MKVQQLYIYPVKSLRGIPVSSAEVVDTGLKHDRTFMLMKVEEAGNEGKPRKLKNMHITFFPQMSLFKTAMAPLPSGEDDEGHEAFTVEYSGPEDSLPTKTISIPLVPETGGLETVDVEMHSSPTKAYDMGKEYSAWFTEQFGFEVILAYIGSRRRPVLGSFLPSQGDGAVQKASRFLSSYLPTALTGKKETGITFADCAMFLVVTEESLKNASSRLPEGVEMDIKKFRPNIVISGAGEPWVEDYWGGISIDSAKDGEVDIPLTANCIRCTSINIDYSTGKPGLGEDGKMLKKLMADRRVDKGAKYSPVFGRYGYLGRGIGKSIAIDHDVTVVKKLDETTTWDWPGL